MSGGKKKKCFVISRIGDEGSPERKHADFVLRYLIREALDATYTVDRADNPGKPGQITAHIVTSIRDADLVLADLTGRNPNVYYELGLAHILKKPVVYMNEDPVSAIAFDLHNENVICYSAYDVEKHDTVRDQIRKHADECFAGRPITNPVTAAIGTAKLDIEGDSRDLLLFNMQKLLGTLAADVARLHDKLNPRSNFDWVNSGLIGGSAPPTVPTGLGLLSGLVSETILGGTQKTPSDT